MDNMSRDKVEHYYLLTAAFLMSGMASSSLNIWNATWKIHRKRTPVAAEHTASRYQNDKLMQYQIGKKGP
jgi:ABC-type transport system involved in Fe-S cluster assembly fused permease/ATPase subunit